MQQSFWKSTASPVWKPMLVSTIKYSHKLYQLYTKSTGQGKKQVGNIEGTSQVLCFSLLYSITHCEQASLSRDQLNGIRTIKYYKSNQLQSWHPIAATTTTTRMSANLKVPPHMHQPPYMQSSQALLIELSRPPPLTFMDHHSQLHSQASKQFVLW